MVSLPDTPFGFWCVGDQAAVIPSFTEDGMSIALHSAAFTTEMYLSSECAEQYNHKLHAQLSCAMDLATCLSRSMVTKTGRIWLFGEFLFSQMQCDGALHRPVFRNRTFVCLRFLQRIENSPHMMLKSSAQLDTVRFE
jgi:hypothetical protein